MALPSVGQAQLLDAALKRTVKEFQPRSLAVLGVAGGNGLESLDRATVRRVVALDFILTINRSLLAELQRERVLKLSPEAQAFLRSFSSSAMKALGPPSTYPVSPSFRPSASRTMMVG